MHSIWSRANSLFAFYLTAMSVMCVGIFLSTTFLNYSAPVKISGKNVRVKNVVDYAGDEIGARADVAMLELSIEVDLTPVFNWNVKEIFLYLVAEYATPKNSLNQVTLWDKIVLRGDHKVISQERITPKYYFTDDGKNLLGHQNVTLVLRWNIIPHVGYLELAQGSEQFVLDVPQSYYNGRF